jgi:hypothetical protein
MNVSYILVLLVVSVLNFLPSTAVPQSSSRFEVLGVRIGMNADAAVSALRRAGLFKGEPQQSRTGCAAVLRGASPSQRSQTRNERSAHCIQSIRWEGPGFFINVGLLEDLPEHPGRSVVHAIELWQRAALTRENISIYWSELEAKYGKAAEYTNANATWREPGRNNMLLFSFSKYEGQPDDFRLALYDFDFDFDFDKEKHNAFSGAAEIEQPSIRPRF